MELRKATGEVEISHLKQQVQEQEALLTERQAQLETLEGEIETQQKTIEDLNFQKSQLEHDVNQYRTKLEIAVKDKAASEQELKQTKLFIKQSEANWSSTQKKLEDLLKKTNDKQVLNTHSPKLKKINVEEVGGNSEKELESQIQARKNDLAQQPFVSDSQAAVDSEPESSADGMMLDVLQQKLEELVLVQKKAEMAEEKAQSYKKLLDDSNNRLRKLQMDMEAERVHMRQKSEDLQQEIQNLKKSINDHQEESRSLQRAKASLEQTTFFQSTEVEGLKEKLKITQGELQKRSSFEQENSYKINSLEEEITSKQTIIDQLKSKCSELARINVSSDSDIRGLQVQTETLEKERSVSEQKIKSLKREMESWKQQLHTATEENMLMKRSEQAMQHKCKNLEAELQKSDLVVEQLQKKIDEFKLINMEMEENLKNMRAKLDQVMMEINSKDQQIKIFQSQVESSKSQVRIIEEELNKKSQTSHELQIQLQDYNEEVKKTAELQQKIKTLNSNITNYVTEMTTLKLELKSVFAEKNVANQKLQMQQDEISDLKATLDQKNVELQRESSESQKHLGKVKALEDELFQHQNSIKGLTSCSEKITENLKQEIYTLQNDKRATERKVENLNMKLSELSSSLQRSKDELNKETKEKHFRESKIMQLETELQRNKVSMKEVMCSSDKSQSNLQEKAILKREKAEALEEIILLGSEVRVLKDGLQRAQTEAEQKQKENSVLQLKSQQMEEQLEKCKKMLEELKSKLELQKDGYERQLMLVQTEIEKKLILLQSEVTNTSEESNQQSHSADLAEMFNKCFKQDVKQLRTVHQTTVEARLQTEHSQQLQIKMDKLQQERTKLVQDLSKARSEIVQLEEDKIKLISKVSALQRVCNVQTKESTTIEKQLSDSERKLTLKENEARSLRERIESYIRQVQNLQEKLLRFEVKGSETSHQYVKENKADLLKTDVTMTQQTASSNEAAKRNTEDKILKMKDSSEMATMGKENILEGIKQDKTEVLHSQSLQHDSPTKKALNNSSHQTLNLVQKDVQNVTYQSYVKSDLSSSVTAHGYMALCGQTDQLKSNETNTSKTRRYQITEICETINTSETTTTNHDGKLNMTYSSSQKLPELKGTTDIQHLIRFRLLDEEVLRKLEMGLITVQQVQASLAQYVGKPTAIAGVYVESSKKKISFLEAAEKGFLAKTYAVEFLEAQAATGTLTDLTTGETHSVTEALERGIIDKSLKNKLLEAEKAISGYIHKDKQLSVFQAMEERVLDKYKGKRILEVQVATGGLTNPEIGVRVPVGLAVEQGLLNKDTLQSLYDPVSNPKGFHNPDTGQKAYYSEILKTCLYDIDSGVFLFPFGERHITSTSPTSSHRVSVVNSSCGTEMSAYEAFKGKHIDRKTYLFLSQQESNWQEKSTVDQNGTQLHVITDFKSGRQLCLESAVSQRFLESSELENYRSGLLSIYEIVDIIFSRMVVVEDVSSPIAGFWDTTQKKRLSILQGFQQGFTDRATALRLLEAQACTGGICIPSSGEKVSLSEALKRGLLDETLNQQLQQFEQAFNGIIHPKTAKSLSIPQAVQENLFPKEAGFRCIEFQLLTGGLINPDTHDRVSLEEVIQSGLVDKVTAAVLKDEKFQTKSLTCPKTKRRITFREALERSVYDCHTGLRLLEAAKIHGFGAKSTFHYVWAYK
ncbi:plectin-like isoform X1 [Acanthochromis polyacanthus]|uniref:plectin-like isoform X1 n=1 Tax=Acanthochromis polyacanthus TaxID=80966 RepID=UPI002234844D|nr:plectin-like isoform X1 [Acanthochromis polyacanthus]